MIPTFEDLYHRHHQRIYLLILGHVSNPQHAEDLTQNTFLCAWRGLPRLSKASNASTVSAWLTVIALNQVRSFWRVRCRTEQSLELHLEAHPEQEPFSLESLDPRERLIDLQDAVKRLTPHFQRAYARGALAPNRSRQFYRARTALQQWMEAAA